MIGPPATGDEDQSWSTSIPRTTSSATTVSCVSTIIDPYSIGSRGSSPGPGTNLFTSSRPCRLTTAVPCTPVPSSWMASASRNRPVRCVVGAFCWKPRIAPTCPGEWWNIANRSSWRSVALTRLPSHGAIDSSPSSPPTSSFSSGHRWKARSRPRRSGCWRGANTSRWSWTRLVRSACGALGGLCSNCMRRAQDSPGQVCS